MTLPNSDEGNLEPLAGGAESPVSQPSSGNGQPLTETLSALVKRLDEQDKFLKGLQKGTDKRFEQIGGSIKRILELKAQGLNESQIERELWIDSQMKGQTAPPPEPVGNENSRQVPDVESAFKTVEEYGLSQNDPDFLALVRLSSRLDKAAFDAKVKDFVLGKVKPQKPANPADVVQAPATQTSKTPDAAAKIARLKELQKTPTKHWKEIDALTKELDAVGWQ